MTFDRLIYIDRLKEAGITEAVARAHAEALRDALFETVATKADLNEATHALTEAIQAVDRRVGHVEETFDRKIDGVADTLDRKIDGLADTLDRKIDSAADTLDRKIDRFAENLDRKIDGVAEKLDRKIEISARDLTIKGAGGLIVIASIIVGLKLFG